MSGILNICFISIKIFKSFWSTYSSKHLLAPLKDVVTAPLKDIFYSVVKEAAIELTC